MVEPITPEDAARELTNRKAKRELARRHLRHFIRESWPITNPGTTFEHNWHVDVVADHIEQQLRDWAAARVDEHVIPRCQDLLINIPPRCLKSTIVSVCATAWAWLHWPTMRIGCLSVNPRVSFRDALAVRALIQSNFYQALAPSWDLREDQNAVGNFANTAGGSRIARGFDSNVVGEGFDWFLVDDPHDPRDSEAAIQAVIMGWDVALSSRVNDARCSIRTGIMQCITEGDFSDHVRKQGWGWLCLPMEFEPEWVVTSPYGWTDKRMIKGECLHPSRFPPRVLEQRKLELGTYGYAAQYQQRPAPLGGGMIKRHWFKRFTLADIGMKRDRFDLSWMTITCDATFGSTAATADNVGLLVAGGRGPNRYIFEDATRAMTFLETIAAIKALLATWPGVGRVLIEKAANGPAIAEQLRAGVNAGSLRTIVVEELTTHLHGNKVSRATAMSPAIEAGCVFLLDGASWIEAFVSEHGLFPNGLHDDRVDALSQLMAYYDESRAGVERARKLSGLGGMLASVRR